MSTVDSKPDIMESEITVKGKTMSLRKAMECMDFNRSYNDVHREYGYRDYKFLCLLDDEQREAVFETDEYRSELAETPWQTLRYLYENTFEI